MAPQDSARADASSPDKTTVLPATDAPAQDSAPADSTYYARRLINLVFVGGSTLLLLAGGFLGMLAVFFFVRAKLSEPTR